MIREMLEGIKRIKPTKDSRLPITISLLRHILMTLPSATSSHYEKLLFRAAYSLCFFAFLRVVEVVDSKNCDRMFTSSHVQ